MTQERRSQGRVVAMIVFATLAVVIALWAFSGKPPEQELPTSAPLVRVERAEPRDHRFVVRAHGSVAPRAESDLVPQVSGEVVWMSRSLVPGGFFEKGEALLEIDRADYEVEREAARAAVARAESEFARAETERDRQRQLADRSVASQARIDDAENRYNVTRAQLAEAKARLRRAVRDLERTKLRAPYPGRVRSEKVDLGQFVQRGTSIGSIYSVDYAEVRLPLPDRELAYVDVPLVARRSEGGVENGGSPVTLRAEFAGAQRSWQGEIVRTEGELDPRSRMVHVVARVADPYAADIDMPLAVGLFVEAEIVGRTLEGAYVLPRTALRPGGRVYVVAPDDTLEVRDVEVVRTERDRIVIGAGLAPGDRVCVSPLGAAIEGMEVRVADDAPELAGVGS